MPNRKPTARSDGSEKAKLGKKGVSGRRLSPKPATKQKNAAAQNLLIVNMIPKSLSSETNQDSEPTLAVNPVNPQQIAASAFTPDPGGGNLAPIYVSTDGGNTWLLNSIVPSDAASGSMTADITVAFSSSSSVLYAGIIRLPIVHNSTRLNILSTEDFLSSTKMKVLVDRMGVDQPFVEAATAASGAQKGKDQVFVGSNDFGAPNGKTATIDRSSNGTSFSQVRIESRTTSGQDGPPVRPAIHADGTIYAVYHAWRTFDSNTGNRTADIVVVRDDNWGNGAPPFGALKDSDNLSGKRVVQNSHFNFEEFLGLERIGGAVAIAVDPTNSDVAYVSWADTQNGVYTIHLRKSSDRGVTWSANDLNVVASATNPAVAVNGKGTIGFLYQQLIGTGASQRFVTHFQYSDDGKNWIDLILADTPANTPQKVFDPYLGDYAHLLSVGNDFYGIFSANNEPDPTHFPNGVNYQRNHDFAKKQLLDTDGVSLVDPSIDPFFFKVSL
ncbi:MAG: glycoside hydrolase [Acidobacteriota bacterium]|nr:glycoside hydrolase [Acidobacteriota bacterium]